MSHPLTDLSFPFELRGVSGTINVRYGVNDDPRRWGYEVLDLDWYQEDRVRGFPVVQASVEHPAEGYAAQMGWVQVVRYQVADAGSEEDTTVFDVPPQLSETDTPYLAFGVRPTMFDAPAIGAREVTWRASTFLTYTPDALLSRVVSPLRGFTWGYDVVAGDVRILERGAGRAIPMGQPPPRPSIAFLDLDVRRSRWRATKADRGSFMSQKTGDRRSPRTRSNGRSDTRMPGSDRRDSQDLIGMTRTRVPPVLVTGATGRIGRAVIDLLIDAGVPVRALIHRSEAAASLPANVDVFTGDLTVPESLDAGLQGVGAVFLVWTAPPATAPAVVGRLATYAQRVVFLSAPHRTPHPFFQQPNPMAVLYADIERRIAAAGLESTIIRPGMLASNALFWWAPAIRADGVVRWPYGTAETAPIDDRDVAAVAALTLYQDGHAGGDYVLTGPDPLSQAEQVRIIGDVVGRPIRFEELSPEEFRRETEGSWPVPVVDMLLAAWGATIGTPAFITSTVFDILGSAPRSFRQWVTDHATAFMEDPAPSS